MKIYKIYQNVGSAPLTERAVLVLDPLSVSSAKSVLEPLLLCDLGASVVSSVAVLLGWASRKGVIWPADLFKL